MQKCDGTADCPKLATEPEAWDERDCPQPIDCHAPAYLCRDKQTCLDESQVCDGVEDCPLSEVSGGGEEEEDCEGSGATVQDCQEGESEDQVLLHRKYPHHQQQQQRCNMDEAMSLYLDEWNCDDSCIEGSLRCDGTINCQDGRYLATIIIATITFHLLARKV